MKGGGRYVATPPSPEHAVAPAPASRARRDSPLATARLSTVRHGPSAIRARRMDAPLRINGLPMIQLSDDRQQDGYLRSMPLVASATARIGETLTRVGHERPI